MRGYVPSPGVTGHDHFFDTFDKFSGTDRRHKGEWLDEVATRAAAQNEQYLELMDTPDFSHAAALAHEIGWHDDFAPDARRVAGARICATTSRSPKRPSTKLKLRVPSASAAGSRTRLRPAAYRFVSSIRFCAASRRSWFLRRPCSGFETVSADPRVVGINFVMPEDGYISMTDYALQMRMVGFLHEKYPKVHITLHAGELAPGLVTEEGLCCHIRLAVEQGHAERIGHGVDVMYEDRPYDLLKEMAAKHVMVEVALTSNDVILGVSGKDHPFPIYRKFGVPVALSTDDEGVSRIDLTHEYVRAVETYGLRYADLKQLVRTGLEHSFLPGASLWSDPDTFQRPVAACAQEAFAQDKPSESLRGISARQREGWAAVGT